MRFLFQFLIYLILQVTLYAQIKSNCHLIDSSGNTVFGLISKYDFLKIQEKIVVRFDSSKVHAYRPSEIKNLEYFRKSDTLRYETINFNNNEILAYLEKDGGLLKFYTIYFPGRKTYKAKTIVFKDGINISQVENEQDNMWIARVLSDYPVLSEMAKNKQFDIIHGYERQLIIDEYNIWKRKYSKDKIGDEPTVLKAIADANKLYNSKKYLHICHFLFWGTFPLVFVSGITSALIADSEPKYNHLGLKDKTQPSSPLYLKAYKLRAHTLKAQACLKGVYLM